MRLWGTASIVVALALMVLAGIAFAGVFPVWVGVAAAVLGFLPFAGGTLMLWLARLDHESVDGGPTAHGD